MQMFVVVVVVVVSLQAGMYLILKITNEHFMYHCVFICNC